MYILKPNLPGVSFYVANGEYMVHPNYQEKELQYINLAISREAKIRLFSCEIEINCGNL